MSQIKARNSSNKFVEQKDADIDNDDNNTNEDKQSSQKGRRNSLTMSKNEEQSLTKLVQQIKSHTQHLKSSKENLNSLHNQFGDAKKNINDEFEKAMSSLLVRRKQLEGALEQAETETIGKLEERIKEIETAARSLFSCKQHVEVKLKQQSQGLDREKSIVEEVTKSLSNLQLGKMVELNLVYDVGTTSLNNFIENYGSVAVGTRKIATGGARISGKSPSPNIQNEST